MEIDVTNEKKKAIDFIVNSSSLSELIKTETELLGRNGLINSLLKQLKNIIPEKRKTVGININALKQEVITLINQKKQLLSQKIDDKNIDVTMPGTSIKTGTLHPITIAITEISSIFSKLGFIRMSYPEVEWEYLAFDTLNMPKTHPARDDFETTFVNGEPHPTYGKMILTPHTSSGQIREMWRLKKPPIRMINIGKCYRPNWDATHTPMFHQFEGLCVDTDINITHLKGALDYFAKEYFGENTQTRLRPHHFQFTEPSFEVDISCTMCQGTGILRQSRDSGTSQDDLKVKCKICKSGWLELGGTGMVHPNVLISGGIDPIKYSGWAFGFGIERVIMMKYGVDDIRNYYSGDMRFLSQF
ncbi:phenylalanine--tRNA ligase subunit alpha [Candidatus Roizmanbacteria bacterium CG_4_10_14_0_8_um_filter_33_9]|uniref:Phenylalanine--tRNA ligase alpha subunit n=1 Tax=Candidatus Roizmanbacteria bacterium CG_4_10_14_0_8_um_filter_33_9 TaxID=1974826 RepID=A0A2M7QIX7_9BACT|nr:MAG: phenylalanine--tRNA ligase subunit alpha [Candidatus Roizmanbacteria bacterium CG_4_10_14_0_8_um_filter_33_9]